MNHMIRSQPNKTHERFCVGDKQRSPSSKHLHKVSVLYHKNICTRQYQLVNYNGKIKVNRRQMLCKTPIIYSEGEQSDRGERTRHKDV